MFNYIIYRVYEHFDKKDSEMAVSNALNFLSLFQGALIVPVFMTINLFVKIDSQIFGIDNRIKYYIGIPLAILLMIINSLFFKKKLIGNRLGELEKKYHKERYILPIWLIFIAPVLFVFVFPIAYGALNGTISFPFLEK